MKVWPQKTLDDPKRAIKKASNRKAPCKDGILTSRQININNGIFQGDSLSLSSHLFCKAFAPLSPLLNSPSYGYTTSTRTTFHLFYMDDLETFGKHDQGQTGLLIIVKGFSDDIQMAFELDKCSEATFKTGKQEKEIGMYDFPVADCTHEQNVCPYFSSITFQKNKRPPLSKQLSSRTVAL